MQKGFGLPAGLGVLILSPAALARATELTASHDNLDGSWQWPHLVAEQAEEPGRTPHTPNLLNIYLLESRLTDYLAAGGIETIASKTRALSSAVAHIIEQHPHLHHFVVNPAHRSPTICAVTAEPALIDAMHAAAPHHHLTLGLGYGELNQHTFHIATFPAHEPSDIETLTAFLESVHP